MFTSYKRHFLGILSTLAWLSTAVAVYGANHALCSDCHVQADPQNQGPELIHPLPDLCLNCHAERIMKSEHPSGIEAGPEGTGGLPLIDGLISCTTCHDSHSTATALLRLPGERLCAACHSQ